MSSEHVEVLRDLSEVCRAAIKAGDWKVDGACDPDAALRRADAAIASLSAPKPEGEWVLVPREPTPEMLSAAGRLQACECGFIGDMSPMDGEEYAAMLAAAPQPPAEAQAQGVGEVAAWRYRHPDGEGGWHGWIYRAGKPTKRYADSEYQPLYTAPPSAPVGVEAAEHANVLRDLLADEYSEREDDGSPSFTLERAALQAAIDALVQQPAAEVYVDFPQVGTAGPLAVVDGKVTLPDTTMNDLIRHARTGYVEQPAAVDDSALLDALASEYWKLDPFDMPTPGGDDADVGWRVIQYHRGHPHEREVAVHYGDDPRAALRAALAAQQGGGAS